MNCNSRCRRCIGTTATQCTACYTGLYLYSVNSSCLACTASGVFISGTSCVRCAGTCMHCFNTGSNQCTACYPGTYLLSPGSCVACNTGNPSPFGTNCVACDSTCATCTTGASATSCLTCFGGRYLYSANSSCIACNAGGVFISGTSCLDCASTCSYCTGTESNQCTACYTGTYLLSSGSCVACNTGNPSPSGANCVACDSTCAACTVGASATSCITCANGRYSQNSICNLCYISTSSPFSCATCSGGASYNCLSCNPGTFLYPETDGQCLENCPDGYWEDNSTNVCQSSSTSGTSSSFSSYANQIQLNSTSILSKLSSILPAGLLISISAVSSSDSTSGVFMNFFLCLSAIESVANMQYLNIKHSKIALDAYSGLSSSIIPNWFTLFNNLNSEELIFEYGIFEQNQLSSLFLDNYGDSLTGFMVYLAIYLFCAAISLAKTKEKLLNCRIGRIYVAVFGLFVSTISGGIQSQILFSAIQFLEMDLLIDVYSRISYITAYLFLCVTVGLQALCFFEVMKIFNKKMKVIKAERLRKRRIRRERSSEPRDNLRTGTDQPSVDDIWKEKKYEIVFNSFKETNKHSFFFTYWMMLYDIIYIVLILALQNIPVFQCLSLVILIIILILFSATIKPFKEKSVAFLFFFNFASVLILAIINMALAIQANINGNHNPPNDQVGWAIFAIIMINSCINMIVGFGGVIYKLLPHCKDLINGRKNA